MSRQISNNTIVKGIKTFEDIVKEREAEEAGSSPISFKELFGDLSDCTFSGHLDLSYLNLNSLEGCPRKVINGNFSIENNPNLKSLKSLPTEFKNVSQFYLNYSLFKKLYKLDTTTKENIAHGIDLVAPFIDSSSVDSAEVIMNMLIVNNFATTQTKVKLLTLIYNNFKVDQEKVRQQKRIYSKLNYDTEKFIRAISLL